MAISRRALLKKSLQAGALASSASALPPLAAQETREAPALPSAFEQLKPIRERIRPITPEEFQLRIEHARRLMTEAKPAFSALYLTPGTSLYYFSGIRWGVTERLLALIIPRQGLPMLVCPAFEEGRLRELLRWPIEVRAWQEDESPSALAAGWLAERGVRGGCVGIEETTRFTFYNALRDAAPTLELVSGDSITIGCRARKSAHELELMQLACEATCRVYRAVFASLQEGITARGIRTLIQRGFERLGLTGDALVLLGKFAALPHGTSQPQKLVAGDVVLIDGGTAVEGYASDVTRCTVLGKPAEKLLRAFETLRKAQDAALDAARRDRLSGSVDDAARAAISSAGYPGGYAVFAHRLGHGIGLDGHEHPYLVRGSNTVLEPGMTFSNEPGIYVRGDYGLRLEDDMVVAEDGPARLLTPGFSPSLEKPVG